MMDQFLADDGVVGVAALPDRHPQRGHDRNATLRDLVAELPPTLVAQALGYSTQVIHLHAVDAAVPMAGYIGMTAPVRATGP